MSVSVAMNLRDLRILYTLFLMGILRYSACAQNILRSEVGNVSSSLLKSPQFRSHYKKLGTQENWLELECAIRMKGKGEKTPTFLDEVQIRWYVITRREKAYFQKELNYQNVLLEKTLRYSCYLSPNSLIKLSQSLSPRKGAVLRFGGEVFYDDKKIDEFTSAGNIGWWKNLTETKQSVRLLSKAQTPFRDFWWDSYAETY